MDLSAYADELNSRIDDVFRHHPEIPDHRQHLPWLTGYLGHPFAGIWFLAENPSLTTATRSLRGMASTPTVESQWAISQGDQLLRTSLVQQGFKTEPWDSPGGWHCYLTDVIKQAEQVSTWQKQGERRWLQLAEIWSAVLAWELETSRPRLVVVMGKRTRRLIEHLALVKQLRFPRIETIQHYAYVGSRPRGKQAPMQADRVQEYRDEVARVAQVFTDLQSEGASQSP